MPIHEISTTRDRVDGDNSLGNTSSRGKTLEDRSIIAAKLLNYYYIMTQVITAKVVDCHIIKSDAKSFLVVKINKDVELHTKERDIFGRKVSEDVELRPTKELILPLWEVRLMPEKLGLIRLLIAANNRRFDQQVAGGLINSTIKVEITPHTAGEKWGENPEDVYEKDGEKIAIEVIKTDMEVFKASMMAICIKQGLQW